MKGLGQNTKDNTFLCEMISHVSIPSNKFIGKCLYRNISTANESCYKADNNVCSMTTYENTTVWDASDGFSRGNLINVFLHCQLRINDVADQDEEQYDSRPLLAKLPSDNLVKVFFTGVISNGWIGT